MTLRVFVVGTDTSVGKTTVVTHLLQAAHRRGRRVLPFKPAASGDAHSTGDPARLLAALRNPRVTVDEICPLQYAAPLAPGIACDPDRFIRAGSLLDEAPLARVRHALEHLERRHRPDVVLIEGAGGLYVPMPGGSWQPAWIRALSTQTLVVGRAGLGAINHACLTAFALRHLELPPLGFVLVETTPPDPSNPLNAALIAKATSLPHLGTLPYGPPPTQTDDPLAAVWDRLGP